MAWQDDAEKEIVIITGDRKRYTPKWLKPLYRLAYNVTSFNFPNQKGTLVKKFQPQGAKYSLEIYFDGPNHLQTVEEFKKSSEDTRHWHILHPYYGNIRVQPTEFTFDNTAPNLTKITGIMLETLANNFPNNAIDQGDQVELKKEDADIKIAESFTTDFPDPVASDIAALGNSLDLIAENSAGLITTDEDSNEYINLVETARREITLANFDPNAAISAIQNVINYPATVGKSVNQRLTSYLTTIRRFDDTVRAAQNLPKSIKVQFEAISSTLFTALSILVSTTNDPDDYGTRNDVVNVIDIVIDAYNTYIDTLDFIRSANTQLLTSYVPNYTAQTALNSTVNFAIANLFTIALNAKQERNIFLEEDSNVILLTHRFLGLDADDENIDEFIRNNEIGLNELLLIKKGRKITYFV